MADSIHPDVKLYIGEVLQRKQHPEQAYKSCVGILRFTQKVGNERLINACRRALSFEAYNYKTIQLILEKELDKTDAPGGTDHLSMPLHENIRGGNNYQ